jgi:hypothetical protein
MIARSPYVATGSLGDITAEPLTTNSGAMRTDVVVPIAIIASITAFAVWVSLKK